MNLREPLSTAWFPGRACLLGEHCDWGGGSSLAIPLPMGIRVEAYAGERGLKARSRVGEEVWEGEWDGPKVDREGGRLRFVPACAWALRKRNLALAPLRLEITADLPPGRGLSSSAALCLGLLAAMAGAAGVRIDDEELAELAFHVENGLLGIGCGRLDQLACVARAPVFLVWQGGRAKPRIFDRDPLSGYRLSRRLHFVVGAFPDAAPAADILAALQSGHPAVEEALGEFDFAAGRGLVGLASEPELLGQSMDYAQAMYDRLAAELPALAAPKLRAACAGLRERGALGAKFSGAGGDRSVIALFGDEAAARAGAGWLERQGLAAWYVPIGPG